MNSLLKKRHTLLILIAWLIVPTISYSATEQENILKEIQQLAIKQDPVLKMLKFQKNALLDKSVAVGELNDAKVKVGLNNIPLDTLSFNQENMSQFKISWAQQFPAGDTLALKSKKTVQQAKLLDSQISSQKLKIIKQVKSIYYEWFYWKQAKLTVEKNKVLFKQLLNIVKSLFSVGKTHQENLIRAQFELDRLDEKLLVIEQKINDEYYKMAKWIGEESVKKLIHTQSLKSFFLPHLTNSQISSFITNHPDVIYLDKSMAINRQTISILNESYKPDWGLNVSYGNRDDTLTGTTRSDFVSVEATFSLINNTKNRQDKLVKAEENSYLSLLNKRRDLINQMVSQAQIAISKIFTLKQRLQIYKNTLIPQLDHQIKVSMSSYQSDNGDFTELMKAYISMLDIKLDVVRLNVDKHKIATEIEYLLATNIYQLSKDTQ